MKGTKMVPMDNDPNDFYGKPDSAYIRIAYNPAVRGYNFTTRNEIFHRVQDASQIDDAMAALATIVRGLVCAALEHTSDIYQLGAEAEKQDFMELNTENIENEEHKALLLGEPHGVA